MKWITDYLATASYDQIGDRHDLTVIDVRELVDKRGNVPHTVRARLEEAVAFLKRGEKIVVCCDYGMSRSNAIAAGILALNEERSFNDALRQVVALTGETEIKIDVLSIVRRAVQSDDDEPKDSSREKRILVTGGSGFIGKELIRQLGSSEVLYAPGRAEIDLANDSVNLDLFIKEHDISHLVHLANPRIYNTTRALGESLMLLENVLLACRENNLKLIFMSSWEVYSGYSTTSLLATSHLPRLPGGVYGETKYLSEMLIEHYHRQHGLRYALLRSSPVYGGDSDRPKFIHNFIRKAVQNEDIVTHRYLNGFPSLDLLSIDDLVTALSSMIQQDFEGALNVGSGTSVSTAEVATMIVELIGSNSVIRHTEIDEFAANVRMDNRAATSELGWHPRINPDQGLRILIDRVGQRGCP